MKKIKPCPFCGGVGKFENSFHIEPVIDEGGAYIDGEFVYWERTYCPKCEVQFFSDDEDAPEGITIQQWNTRTRKPKAYRK